MYKAIFRYIIPISLISLVSCNEDSGGSLAGQPTDPTPAQTDPLRTCGNGKLDPTEVCDGTAGVPATCSEWDNTKLWATGGAPACGTQCQTIEAGSCREIQCGDGIIDDPEICDGTAGVPATCSEWDNSKRWATGGTPTCGAQCQTIEAGSCHEIQCGDGIIDDPEICDGTEGVPATCSEWDNTKHWATGGAPACGAQCQTIEAGSCREIQCGDGIIDDPEICDGTAGVPATCSEWDDSKTWLPSGTPVCSADCKSIEIGSCEPAPFQLDIMNWNVLFEYNAWGGSEVLPRARIFHDILAQYPKRPDFISMIEASQQWHYPEVNELLADLGYAWAEPTPPNDDDTGYFMTEVIYQTDRFEVVENDFVTLFPYTDEGDRRHKCISFASVMREKSTNALFIIMSAHWDPNIESTKCTYSNNVAGPIIMRERNRVRGVAQTVDLINKLLDKYPGAHVFYGGDLNTIDFNLIYESPGTSALLGSTPQELVKRANMLYLNAENEPCGKPLDDDFTGSFDAFVQTSGLYSARDQALATGVALNDVSSLNAISTESSGMGSTIQTIIDTLLKVKLIIDYAFYSPSLTLTEYEVMTGEDYVKISDHYPIRTQYTYYVNE